MFSLSLSLSIKPSGQNMPRRACVPESLAGLRVAGTAFFREIGHNFEHKRNIGPVAHEAPLTLHIHQPAVHNGLEVEGKIGGRYAKLPGDIALHKAARRVSDQQPEYVQPDIGGKRLKNFAGLVRLHGLIIQHQLIYVKPSCLRNMLFSGISSGLAVS